MAYKRSFVLPNVCVDTTNSPCGLSNILQIVEYLTIHKANLLCIVNNNKPKEKLIFGLDRSLSHHVISSHDSTNYKKVTRIYGLIIARRSNEVVQVLHNIKLQLFGDL